MSLFWRVKRRWSGGDVVLSHIRRHECGEEGKFEGSPDPIGLLWFGGKKQKSVRVSLALFSNVLCRLIGLRWH